MMTTSRPAQAAPVNMPRRVHNAARPITLMTDAEMRTRSTGQLSVAEAIQTLAHEAPDDAAATLRAKWPDLWAEIVGAGRGYGLRPVPMMVELIKRGLGQ